MLSKLCSTVTRVLLSALARKTIVIRIGFALVLALLCFSALESYLIRQNQSDEALQIYRHHVEEDAALYRLRRTLWLGAVAARDFLLNPKEDREASYLRQVRELRDNSERYCLELERLDQGRGSTKQLAASFRSFWDMLGRVPAATAGFNVVQRYEFVQSQIAPRRNAVGDVLRNFTGVTQNALNEIELEFAGNRRMAARRSVTVLALCGFLAFLVAWLSLSHSENLERVAEEQYLAVEQARLELQRLTVRLMEIQEEERARLSRDLHDEIGQALATLRLEIVRTANVCRERVPEVLGRLDRARDLAEQTVKTVRNMSTLLRPSLLDDLGLEPSLRWQAEEFSARTGVPCRLTIPEFLPALPDAITTCIFRVTQEAIHNCEKHARASAIEVSLHCTEGLLTVEIIDDGAGFLPERSGFPAGGHLGIIGMRERATAVGGTLRAESAPHVGTRISLEVPLETSSDFPDGTRGAAVPAT